MTGKTYGRLTVIRFDRTDQNSRAHWLCKCECGTEKTIQGWHLRSGQIISCGCYHKERTARINGSHGMKNTCIYRVWRSMINRCRYANRAEWENYGGRGISVCERWEDFTNFLEDMGHPPEGMSIDRIDNDGNYEPGNCRWATRKQQNRNSRRALSISAFGKTQCLKAWADEYGLKYHSLRSRLRMGWTIEEALLGKRREAIMRAVAEIGGHLE